MWCIHLKSSTVWLLGSQALFLCMLLVHQSPLAVDIYCYEQLFWYITRSCAYFLMSCLFICLFCPLNAASPPNSYWVTSIHWPILQALVELVCGDKLKLLGILNSFPSWLCRLSFTLASKSPRWTPQGAASHHNWPVDCGDFGVAYLSLYSIFRCTSC